MRYEWGGRGVLLRDGEPVGRAAKAFWRERATVTTDDDTWSFRAQGHKRIVSTGPDGAERVVAACSGWLSPVWTVDGEAATYRVRRGSLFSSRLVVDRDGESMGSLTSAGWATDRPALDVGPEVPLVDVVLLLWVGYVARQRASSEAAAATTAAT